MLLFLMDFPIALIENAKNVHSSGTLKDGKQL